MSKYYVELSYRASENVLSVFRTDAFFFEPTERVQKKYINEEQNLALKYLSRFMRKPKSEGSIIIKEIRHNGVDCNGVEAYIHVPLVMLLVENGAVLVRHWLEKYSVYSNGTAMSPDNGVEKLKETLEIL